MTVNGSHASFSRMMMYCLLLISAKIKSGSKGQHGETPVAQLKMLIHKTRFIQSQGKFFSNNDVPIKY